MADVLVMFPQSIEMYLPLKFISRSFERKQRRLKVPIFILFVLGIVIFFVNYSFAIFFINYCFPSLQKTTINGSNNSVPVNVTPIDQSLIINRDNPVLNEVVESKLDINTLPSSSSNSSKKIWLDFCNLPDLDPWDPSIIQFIKPETDHMLDCTRRVYEHSKLINGQLFIYSKEASSDAEMNCQMRCLFPNGDWNLEYGDWIKVINGTKPECDIVEVECRLMGENEVESTPFYKYLHAQVYRRLPSLPLQSPPAGAAPEKYDVHIIIFDSTSQTHVVRSMPKTIHMLQEYYEAIPFRHLNKIGMNSHPNAFGFLMGKMIEDIPESPFSKGYNAEYKSVEEACKTPMDNEQFIGFRFKDDGYVTMMAEDWHEGVFMFPGCVGFKKTPMDHYMKPFQLRLERRRYLSPIMNKIVHKLSCREHHHDIMDYLKGFVKAYPDKPKFSLTWMTYLTHGFPNSLSSSDDYFYRFFKDTVKDFENSFIFFMGDHGSRYGELRETPIGEIEDFNPALFLSVPKPLRNNSTFMHQLRSNAKELVTHYDIYATLNEIATPTNPRIPNPLIHGASLFHPLPYPRTCDSLRIPFEFCKCRSKKIVLPRNNTFGLETAKLMVEQMNINLTASAEISNRCAKLSLNETAEIIVEDYGGEQNIRVFKIIFSTLPGNGKFWGIISLNPSNQEIQILSSMFLRLNSYKIQAKCAIKRNSKLASYCFCIH